MIRRLDVARGAERVVSELVRQNACHDVLVFAGGPSAYDLGNTKVRRAKNFVHALWMCVNLRVQYDVVHLHLPPSTYLAIILGRRAIVHEHSMHNEGRRLFWHRFLSGMAMRRAAAVIAVSEAARKSILNSLGSAGRVYVIPNFAPKLPSAKSISSEAPNLLMVAAFSGPKRQDELIRALPCLPESIRVSFAGDGPALARCSELAESLGVAHRVTFLGSVRDLSSYYAKASLCVLLSEWEGFGLVVLEAAQFGKATLVSDIDALRESCPDTRLIYTGSTPQDLAHKILQTIDLCSNPEFCTKLRSYADAHDLDKYSSDLTKIYVHANESSYERFWR